MRRDFIRWLSIVVPALLPVIIWWLFKPAAIQFSSSAEVIDALAKIASLTGLSLLAISIIISARLKLFDRIFFGLDNMYRTHHLMGGWVILFLLIHSGLLILKFSLISPSSGYEFIVPSADIPLTLGKLTLVVMTGLVVLTMYFKVRYQWFIVSMRILGAGIFLGGFHALFVSGSDLLAIKPLLIYMAVLSVTAASVYIYRSILRRPLHKPYDYVIDEIIPHKTIAEIWMKPAGPAMQRFAGQFSYVTFLSKAVEPEAHPFTISSGSNDERIRYCIKNVGDFTATVASLRQGDPVLIDGPYGSFSFTKMHRLQQVWLAGGIGITPFLAMARSLDPVLQYRITLYYIIKTKAEAIFLNELETISKQHEHFKVIPIFTDLQGRPTGKNVILGKPTTRTDILICGPSVMMKTMRSQLVEAGVPRRNIYTEEFVL